MNADPVKPVVPVVPVGIKDPMDSKTIRFNAAIMAVLPLLRLFGVEIPAGTETALIELLPLANILLRMVTSQPIGK